MIPVYQTITGGKNSDCVRACIASLLELDIDEIPNFIEADIEWEFELRQWLRKNYNCSLVSASFLQHDVFCEMMQNCLCLTIGKTPAGEDHAVITKYGTIIHDPNPKEVGLQGYYSDWGFYLFVPNDPIQLKGE